MDSWSVTQHPEFSQEFLQQLHKEINTIKTKLPRGTSSNTVVLHSEADEAGSNTDNLLFDEIQYEWFRMKVKTPYAHQQSINDNAGPMPKPALHMIQLVLFKTIIIKPLLHFIYYRTRKGAIQYYLSDGLELGSAKLFLE